ncbi:MAG: hypothetical protein RR585_03115 [Coprobacillus sp.]
MDKYSDTLFQVKEVKETDNNLEVNRFIDTGEWILISTHKESREIGDNEVKSRTIYCLGKIK